MSKDSQLSFSFLASKEDLEERQPMERMLRKDLAQVPKSKMANGKSLTTVQSWSSSNGQKIVWLTVVRKME